MGSASRIWRIARSEVALGLRQPLLAIYLLSTGSISWGMARAGYQLPSGSPDSPSWSTSQFALAWALSRDVSFALHALFASVFVTSSVLRDGEHRTEEMLHTTPLTPREFYTGKLFGLAALLGLILFGHTLIHTAIQHLDLDMVDRSDPGPLRWSAFLVSAGWFLAPAIAFVVAISIVLAERTRGFVPPLAGVALVVTIVITLKSYQPADLAPVLDRCLMAIDPSGGRWLDRVWIDEDRGASFYNESPIAFDGWFISSRIAYLASTIAALGFAASRLRKRLRHGEGKRARSNGAPSLQPATFADLRQPHRTPSLLAAAASVGRIELRQLVLHPAFLCWGVLLFLATWGTVETIRGPFHTPLRLSTGLFAAGSYIFLVLFTVPLLVFSIAASAARDRKARLWEISRSTPARPSAHVLGHLAANLGLLFVTLVAVWCGGAAAVIGQGGAPWDFRPFLLFWGVFLLPVMLPVMALTTAVSALTGSRSMTCVLVLGTWFLALGSGFRFESALMVWLNFYWVRWTDMGQIITAWEPVLASRAWAIAATAYFLAIAAIAVARRPRLRRARLRFGLVGISFVALPITILLLSESDRERWFAESAWFMGRKNLFSDVSWSGVPEPELLRAEIELIVEPESRTFRVRGTYRIGNPGPQQIPRLAMAVEEHWSESGWTLNGLVSSPKRVENGRLFAVELVPGETVTLGFDHQGRVPSGRGGFMADMEFLLPSGIVLTNLSTSFLPRLLGDEDQRWTRREPDEDEDDFEGPTGPLFGSKRPFDASIVLDSPPEYTLNSVGRLVDDRVVAGRRIRRFETDHPVIALNVVGARYAERRGRRATVFHHPAHDRNVARIVETMDHALDLYSEWFCPYPWAELRLSEFPGLVDYAQGFPTNIPFSESMGFLAREDPRVDPAFLVTAHEVAHQWWGNLVVPGQGGGANVLSEGLAHFSVILLADALHGPHKRMEVCRWFESNYLEDRWPDWEEPLLGTGPMPRGGISVMYDKGGWAFWILYDGMGRDRFLEGIREFIATYRGNADHPVLMDFVSVMRGHAKDEQRFDEIVAVWFSEVHVPEFAITEIRTEATPSGSRVQGLLTNRGTGRMPVPVAATSGSRFDRDGRPAAGYRESRVTVVVGAGEPVPFVIECDFRPDRVVVDPDVVVLQRGRTRAAARP